MFHSNQVIDLTVELNDLADAVKFIMALYGTDTFARRESPVKLAFAEPAPGMYAIGSGSFPGFPDRHIPGHPASRGWTDYPFDYDPDIIAQIIKQWVKNSLNRRTRTRTGASPWAYESGPCTRPCAPACPYTPWQPNGTRSGASPCSSPVTWRSTNDEPHKQKHLRQTNRRKGLQHA